MSIKHTLIKGTLLLTVAGMISRLIGFYYRIFLTHAIGAEGIGIYQLIFPVYALCFSLTSAGIQTTVSRLVAANDIAEKKCVQFRVFRVGLALSLSIAFVVSTFIYSRSQWIAIHFLQEERCANLLQILALTIPCGSIHSAVSGYYYGIKNAAIPSVTQLIEQVIRVLAVYTMVTVLSTKNQLIPIDVAVWGIVLGEAASSIVSITAIKCRQGKLGKVSSCNYGPSRRTLLSLILRQSVPLTANRLSINLLQSVEAILIPSMLRCYGLTTSQSLSTYGTLTGMALPLILFPSAITNSVSVMLLPTIAQAQAKQNIASIRDAIENSMKYCLLLGIYCTGIFLLFGNEIGVVLFHNQEAGKFIVTLAWICPFLYITTTLGSIVHGLGKTFLFFIYNCTSLMIRIGFVVFFIPRIGILGYLWGVLASQLVLTALLICCLNKQCRLSFKPAEHIVFPVFYMIISAFISKFLVPLLEVMDVMNIFELAFKALTVTIVYVILAFYGGALKLPKS